MKNLELKNIIRESIQKLMDEGKTKKGCSKRKEGKCCDGGDGRKCGTWTTVPEDKHNPCKCVYKGPCCSGNVDNKILFIVPGKK